MNDMGFWNYAQRDPGALALVDPDERRCTRGELLEECNRLVHGLRALGLGHGDVVAVIMPNCREFIAVYLAVAQAGFYLVPVNWHLAGPEVAYILKDSGAKAFISHERVADTARAAADEAGLAASARYAIGSIEGFLPYAKLCEGQPATLPADRAAGTVMNYTSGTTGRPKGVRRPLLPIDPDTASTMAGNFLQIFGIRPEQDNVHIVGSPLYHTAVLQYATMSLHLGHAVVVMDKWEPEAMLARIEKYRVTTSHMVPTQFVRLLKLPPEVRARYDVSSTRTMIHAAAPCPPDIKRQMIEWWGNSISEYYAATEGGGTIVSAAEWMKYPGTVGRPWPGADVKIFDDAGNELPRGQQGTVYMLLNQQLNFEYKGDSDKTRSNRIGDYFTVGDIGYLNEEGYLFLCDRKIDMIISGGANIYPAEIENVLILHPAVADCAVFGIPDEDWGEAIKAVVQLKAGEKPGDAMTANIMDFLSARLARMKLPRSIDYMEELPRDPNGKLYKRRLRDPYWSGRERKV
jgi:long-chain acyl-CoA synthetase